MSANSPNHDRLLDEKSLWGIYSKSRAIPSSKFNFWVTCIISLVLVCDQFLSNAPVGGVYEKLKNIETVGLTVALSTLAFLVAGYTIFATLTQPALSLAMNSHINRVSGLTYLKHNHFIFIRVFIYYLIYAVFCLFSLAFGNPSGLVRYVVNFSPDPELLILLLVKGVYVLLLVGLLFLILQLKSFIFNLYHAVMTSLKWEAG